MGYAAPKYSSEFLIYMGIYFNEIFVLIAYVQKSP